MANIRTHPTEWQNVLNALDAEDIDKAKRLVVKYEFNHDKRPKRDFEKIGKHKKYLYYSKSPEGVVREFKATHEIADSLGIRIGTVHNRLARHDNTWKKGDKKGWTMWRERIK